DAVVIEIREVDVAAAVRGQPIRQIDRRARRRPTVATEAGGAGTRDGRDEAGGLDDLADALVAPIADVEVAGGVHGHAAGVVQVGGGGCDVVAVVTGRAVAGDGDDEAACLDDLTDPAVVPVRDEDVAAGVHGHAVRLVHRGRGGRDVVAVVGGLA